MVICVCVLVSQSCWTLYNPMDCSPPGSSVHGIPQARYWSGLPFPSPTKPPNPGIKPGSPALLEHSLLSEPPRKTQMMVIVRRILILELLKFERKEKCVIVSVKIICQGSLFMVPMELWSSSQFAVLFGHILALRLWSNCLSSLSVSFLIYEVRIIRTSTI